MRFHDLFFSDLVSVHLFTYKQFLVFQVKSPVACGIASLGYDHMELLGI